MANITKKDWRALPQQYKRQIMNTKQILTEEGWVNVEFIESAKEHENRINREIRFNDRLDNCLARE